MLTASSVNKNSDGVYITFYALNVPVLKEVLVTNITTYFLSLGTYLELIKVRPLVPLSNTTLSFKDSASCFVSHCQCYCEASF